MTKTTTFAIFIAVIFMIACVSAQTGMIVSAPHNSNVGETKTSQIFINGVDNGTVVSNAPVSINLPDGSYAVTIVRENGDAVQMTVNVTFGKMIGCVFPASKADNAYENNAPSTNMKTTVGNIVSTATVVSSPGTSVGTVIIRVTNNGPKTETHTIDVTSTGGNFESVRDVTLKSKQTTVYTETYIAGWTWVGKSLTPNSIGALIINVS